MTFYSQQKESTHSMIKLNKKNKNFNKNLMINFKDGKNILTIIK